MQRQKTIAKWLAIILLLTSIIACYIAFSSIIKNKNAGTTDIAGADKDNSDSNLNPDDSETIPPPVYSTFPRPAEVVNGLSVSHVGGEDNDLFLDTLYYIGKRYVFFYSASTQYDVKDCGIHIATFKDADLLSTTKIAGAEETFVTASIVENGLLVITKNVAQTKLRLLNGNLDVVGESVCPLYSDYKLYVTSAGVKLYTVDERYLYANTISKSLEVKRSNFVYPIDNGEIFYTAGLIACDIIFVQSTGGAGLLTFTATDGFSYINELANCKLLQVLPNSQNGAPVFTLLAKNNEGILVLNVDGSLKTTASFTFKGAKTAVAMQGENSNINIIADGAKAVFCSHLELQSSSPLTFADSSENQTYQAIDGEKEYFLVSQDSTHYLVKLTDTMLTTEIKVLGKNVKVVRDSIGGVSCLAMLFDGNINNDFAHMCFGASDIFMLRAVENDN